MKKDSLVRMAETKGEWCVSVYMPITEADAKNNKLRLKNSMFEAKKKLLGLDVDPFKVARMLAPIEMILENTEFWKDRTEGFAAFFTHDSFVWHSLPYQFDELVVVTDRFHLKPLLRNTSQNRRFYLLALGEKVIKLYEASELGINEVYVKGIPKVLHYFFKPEPEENTSGNDDKNEHLSELLSKIDKSLTDYLKDEEATLIIAGKEYLHPLYQEVNSYPHLLKIGINADVDNLTPKQLLELALPIIKPVFRRKRETALENYQEQLGKGLATDDLSEIFKAAKNGNIETLFVPVGKQKWGIFDDSTDKVRIHKQAKPGDKDLLCVISTRTLRKDGEVFVVLPEQMPNKSSIAAVLRN